MKKFIKNLFILTMISIAGISSTVSAHEMYYNGYGPGWNAIPLKWVTSSPSGAFPAYLVCRSTLGGLQASYYDSARQKWNDACNEVWLTSTTNLSDSTVDITTPTTEWWTNRFGSFSQVLGQTWLYDTAGTFIQSASSAENSTKNIDYAQIYISPDSSIWQNKSGTYMRGVLVHELGHVLTLGHPDKEYYYSNDASIMKYQAQELDTPQTHDKNDISNKY